MTFREFMEAAGFTPYRDQILGSDGFQWRERDELRAAVFAPEPEPEMWWTIVARLRQGTEADTPLGFYREDRFG